MEDFVQESVNVLLHKKCKLIRTQQQLHRDELGKQNHQKNLIMYPKITEEIEETNVLSRSYFGIICGFLIIKFIIFFWIIQQYIKYQCSLFGGRKCYFPFDLLPPSLYVFGDKFIVF